MTAWKWAIALAATLCLGAAAQGCYAWPDYYGPYYDYGYGPPTYTYWGYWPTWDYGSRCYPPPPRHHWRPDPGRHGPGHWHRPHGGDHGGRAHSGRSRPGR
ncbi:MAG: hypothetical protein FJ290_11890 [Planctomycetes bacterium]|nr:hypothetical protein [Planctomycetota bacterium]